ncbi:PLP-dependent aminotransferase family protein [Indiicoccus explosivorum]|uniref:aminotransferase-like domain-containing protein n=1 Tax=Indiicoccus explosivorum TaxID=1917864 RepID=UPI000B450766|nr:PLP-dependent aminotransferase family protein [Indiicoccus explosivorum]
MEPNIPFSNDIQTVFTHDPPGQWLSKLPAGCIRLNSGYPAPSLVPSQELKAAAARLLDEEGDKPLQYIGSPRTPALAAYIQTRMAERDMAVPGDELLVTSGACQAIDLAARVLLDKEAVVAIESPTYMEALEIFQNYTEQFVTVPVDEYGMRTDMLEQQLAERRRDGRPLPRILYTIPTFQNPTGTTLSAERRQHILALAAEYDFLVVEDDAYGELAFGDTPATLKAMDSANRVFYIGSLSKTVAPGMRIGWVAAPESAITVMSWLKKDLGHPFGQALMAAYLETAAFGDRVRRLSDAYHSKRDAMLAALAAHLPESASWYVPEGGYFVWVNIPGIDAAKLLPEAMEAGVAFVPGQYFFLDRESGAGCLRLSFSYESEEQIAEGIRILGAAVTKALGK